MWKIAGCSDQNQSQKPELPDGRIDSYYKSTKAAKCKRTPDNASSPKHNCDIKKCNVLKQRTLSPWLLKGHIKSLQKTTPRRRPKRKLFTPRRSAPFWDPKFRGATILFDTKFKGLESELLITSYFTNTGKRKVRNKYEDDWKSSSETEDTEHTIHIAADGAKTCASCHTNRTPLWRDAEDGTPLCNACGIRYRKYKKRCSRCWNIPRKDRKICTGCKLCGSFLTQGRNIKPACCLNINSGHSNA